MVNYSYLRIYNPPCTENRYKILLMFEYLSTFNNTVHYEVCCSVRGDAYLIINTYPNYIDTVPLLLPCQKLLSKIFEGIR